MKIQNIKSFITLVKHSPRTIFVIMSKSQKVNDGLNSKDDFQSCSMEPPPSTYSEKFSSELLIS